MASLPPQASSRRGRSSPQGRSSSSTPSASDQSQADAGSKSTATDASQAFLLNGSHNVSSQAVAQEDGKVQGGAHVSAEGSDGEPRKCWICLTNESEDTPMSSEWRSPCPCALTAHESCLLDWIADLQSPSNRKRSRGPAQILCPQCKSEITVVRPQSYIVDAVNSLERLTGLLVVPGAIGVLGACVYTGSFVYGLNTVYVIFGEEEATRILGVGTRQPGVQAGADSASDFWVLFRHLSPFAAYHGWSWRLGIGLPLIPAALVLSRTSLADYMLPVLPVIFFASQNSDWEHLDMIDWRPNPSTSLVLLPYLRGAYNGLYEKFFGERERSWIREVQPHLGDEDEEAARAEEIVAEAERDEAAQADDENHFVMEVNLEVGYNEVEEGDQPEEPEVAPAAAQPQPHAQPEQQAPPAGAPANAEEDAQAAGIAAAAAQQHPAQRAGNIMITTSRLADTVLGALLFPAISAAMGGLLKLTLPPSWTTPAAVGLQRGRWGSSVKIVGGITNILQARWGRSIVGGCLFVVLKDALVLYYRWKMAQSHRQRRVLDHAETKNKKKADSRRNV